MSLTNNGMERILKAFDHIQSAIEILDEIKEECERLKERKADAGGLVRLFMPADDTIASLGDTVSDAASTLEVTGTYLYWFAKTNGGASAPKETPHA